MADLFDFFDEGLPYEEKVVSKEPIEYEVSGIDLQPLKSSRNMWEVQTSILKKDFIPTEQDLKLLTSYYLCRWLANHPVGIDVAVLVNSYSWMPIELVYWYARAYVHGVKYITPPKKADIDSETLEAIMAEFKINPNLAKRYMKILPESEQNRLVKKWFRQGRA